MRHYARDELELVGEVNHSGPAVFVPILLTISPSGMVVTGAVSGEEDGSTVGGLVGALGLHIPAGTVVHFEFAVIAGHSISTGQLQHEGVEVGHGGAHAGPERIAVGLGSDVFTVLVNAGEGAVGGAGNSGTVVKSSVHEVGAHGEAVEVHVGNQTEEVGLVGFVGAAVFAVLNIIAAHPEDVEAHPVGHRSVQRDTVTAGPRMEDGVLAGSVVGQTDELLTHTNLDVRVGDNPVDIGLTDGDIGVTAGGVGAPAVFSEELHCQSRAE